MFYVVIELGLFATNEGYLISSTESCSFKQCALNVTVEMGGNGRYGCLKLKQGPQQCSVGEADFPHVNLPAFNSTVHLKTQFPLATKSRH